MVRSLLSAEGIRWFVGHFMTNLQSPLLVWLLLMSIAGGAFDSALKAHRQSPSAYALHIVVIQLLFIVTLVLLLTIVPHALLLSVTGNLFPSSFSDGLIAILCFTVTLCSLTYCVASRHVVTIGDAYSVLCSGVRWFAVVVPLFVVSSQLYYSFMFVLR
jgi:aminobenzoyl-glutamate transport protein